MNIKLVLFQKALFIMILFAIWFLFGYSALQTNIYGQPAENINLEPDVNSVSETVTDYEGNIYNIVQIGNQKWMKESIKSLYYADGSPIAGVVAYNKILLMCQRMDVYTHGMLL
ncbi:MAG: hypothetical protein V1773_16595 [bacterium]